MRTLLGELGDPLVELRRLVLGHVAHLGIVEQRLEPGALALRGAERDDRVVAPARARRARG